jgi:hypothetical protein
VRLSFIFFAQLLTKFSAHNDESIVRKRELSSVAPISDDNSTQTNANTDAQPKAKWPRYSKTPEADEHSLEDSLGHVLENIEKRHAYQERIAQEKLEIERAQEKRELEEQEEWREQAQKRERQERWKQAMDMLSHPSPIIKKRGEQMASELEAEEEQENAAKQQT